MSAESLSIFVYGTLKSGLSNHRWLAGQQLLGEARTKPCYRMFDCGGYPGMVRVAQGGVAISGEVWLVDVPGRVKLDILEDVALGAYALEPVALEEPFAKEVFTYLYRWSVSGLRDAGSDWRET
ncbi:MAG: gamma-glutamylcyclotransferase family protein [Roseimicrobium sp.]